MLPQVTFTIRMPAPLGDAAGIQRLHNKAARTALMAELVFHHKRRFPKHYEAGAKSKYNHMERDPNYLAFKKKYFRGTRDHIKRGRSKRAMEGNAKFSIGGSGTSKFGLHGMIRMYFPFPASFSKSKNRVNLQQMAKELSTITPDEQRNIADSFGRTYTRVFVDGLKNSPRLAKKIGLTRNYG